MREVAKRERVEMMMTFLSFVPLYLFFQLALIQASLHRVQTEKESAEESHPRGTPAGRGESQQATTYNY